MENNNKISLQYELFKSICSSRSNLKDTLDRLQYLVTNFDGTTEHTRAIEFVENCLSLELATLKHLSKMHDGEVRPPSVFKRLLRFFGFNPKTI